MNDNPVVNLESLIVLWGFLYELWSDQLCVAFVRRQTSYPAILCRQQRACKIPRSKMYKRKAFSDQYHICNLLPATRTTNSASLSSRPKSTSSPWPTCGLFLPSALFWLPSCPQRVIINSLVDNSRLFATRFEVMVVSSPLYQVTQVCMYTLKKVV